MTDRAKTYEMFWDCGYCGSTELLGKTHRHCPACGAAQDAGARYFPPEDKKVAVEDHVYVGSDFVCANCSAPCSARAAHCGNCGAAIGDDDGRVTLVRERARPAAKSAPRSSGRSAGRPSKRCSRWTGWARCSRGPRSRAATWDSCRGRCRSTALAGTTRGRVRC